MRTHLLAGLLLAFACEVTAEPAGTGGPALNFQPGGGTIVSGSSITITPSGGTPGATSNYACTAPPGVFVTSNPGAIATGGAAQVLNVSCPAGTADGPMTCTRTGGATTPAVFQVDCPAIGFPYASSPPNMTMLACDGAAGSTQHVAVRIFSMSNNSLTGLACSTSGTGFAIAVAPSATVASGTTTDVIVACTVPAAGSVATGSLNCTMQTPAGGMLAFPLSSQAQAGGFGGGAAVVPASSIGLRLALVSLLAGFGLLLLASRQRTRA